MERLQQDIIWNSLWYIKLLANFLELSCSYKHSITSHFIGITYYINADIIRGHFIPNNFVISATNFYSNSHLTSATSLIFKTASTWTLFISSSFFHYWKARGTLYITTYINIIPIGINIFAVINFYSNIEITIYTIICYNSIFTAYHYNSLSQINLLKMP